MLLYPEWLAHRLSNASSSSREAEMHARIDLIKKATWNLQTCSDVGGRVRAASVTLIYPAHIAH